MHHAEMQQQHFLLSSNWISPCRSIENIINDFFSSSSSTYLYMDGLRGLDLMSLTWTGLIGGGIAAIGCQTAHPATRLFDASHAGSIPNFSCFSSFLPFERKNTYFSWT